MTGDLVARVGQRPRAFAVQKAVQCAPRRDQLTASISPGIQPRFKTMHLLNIESSPRGSKSASIAVSNAFLEAYRQACPGVIVDTLNVWEEKLPDFDQEAIGAKYKGVNKEPMDQAETAVWNKIQELAVRFQQADRIVLGVPMWNFAYPYKGTDILDRPGFLC